MFKERGVVGWTTCALRRLCMLGRPLDPCVTISGYDGNPSDLQTPATIVTIDTRHVVMDTLGVVLTCRRAEGAV